MCIYIYIYMLGLPVASLPGACPPPASKLTKLIYIYILCTH